MAGPVTQVFHMSCDRMKLDVVTAGKTAIPKTLLCDGNVVFREVPAAGAQEQPLEIRGTQLTVDRLDSTPYVTLRGADLGAANGSVPQGATDTAGLAQLSGRGVTMFVRLLEIDALDNRMWSDGQGRATLLVTRNLQGQASATPFPLDLTWQGGLQFDGTTIVFDREVLVAGVDDTMNCDRLSARLNTRIKFGEAIDQQAIDVTELQCDGRVNINHLTRDAVGVTSHERVQLARLSINQQTGAINGLGPGVIRSTRFGEGFAALAGGKNPAAPNLVAPPPNAAGAKLHFLRVDFREGLTGNMTLRTLEFHKNVRAVYGPVDAWEQELDASQPQSLPADAMTMTCDAMRINEDPIAAMSPAPNGQERTVGPIQFHATGDVRIEGQVPNQGPFSAQAETATYESAKDAFVLEGGRAPATLRRAGQTGAPPAARRIRYVRSTNEISVDGIQFLEIRPQDIKAAERPRAVK
jgi:hypothetical protein